MGQKLTSVKLAGLTKFGSFQGEAPDSNLTVQNATYNLVSFDVSPQDTNPTDVTFNATGTRMFMLGSGTGNAYQYDLTTGFDVSTASYSGKSLGVTGQEGFPSGFTFNSTGTRMLVTGFDSDSVHQYNLTIGFDLSSASYSGNSFDVSGQDGAPLGVVTDPTGTDMFVIGNDADNVYQYDLTAGFDVSTASYSGNSFSVGAQDAAPLGLAFNSTGTRMFVTGTISDSVHQYDVGTGFDILTASYSGISFDVSGQEGTPKGVTFNTNGTRMFVIGSNSDSVHQYDL